MPFLVAELERTEITHQDRRAAALLDNDATHVVERLHEAYAADHIAEIAAAHDAAAGARAVGFDRFGHVLERKVEAHELLRIELKLELRGDAAEVRDVGDAGHLLECGDDDPAL